MLIKAAINGGRSKAEHPAIPVNPSEIASAVVESLNAGASAIHFHIRSRNGSESLEAEDLARALQAVRSIAPTAPVGVSTGAWIVPDPTTRVAMISAWTALPDFASVNFIEEGAYEVAQVLLLKGVGVEAGLSDRDAAERFVNSSFPTRCLRVLIEPQEQEIEKARDTVRLIEAVLDRANVKLSRVLHGTEATTWTILEDAIKLGYGIRVGFEDTLRLPNGTVAGTNSDLVKEAIRFTGAEP